MSLLIRGELLNFIGGKGRGKGAREARNISGGIFERGLRTEEREREREREREGKGEKGRKKGEH